MKISVLKSVAIFFSLLISVFLVNPNITQAAYSTGDPVTDQLLDIAQAKLEAEYKALISGKAEDLTAAQVSLTGQAAEKVKDVSDLQLRRHRILAEHGQKYTKSSSELIIQKLDVSNDNATITAKENLTLTLIDKLSKDPVYTKEEKTHVFRFVRQEDKWSLIEDEELGGLRPASPQEGAQKITEKPVSLDVAPGKSDKTRNKSSRRSPVHDVVNAMSGTYTPGATIEYAWNYWNNYNSAYRDYTNNGGDCTNFVSQALNWGGWQHVVGLYYDPHFWWYSPKYISSWQNDESLTWVNVHYFWYFARYSGRAEDAHYLSDFWLGDTMQVDFADPTPDGWLDHNAIVTNKIGDNFFLTYHTPNTRDKSFWDFLMTNQETAQANYYGTLPFYYY
jgi:hypothetical protein